MNKAVEKAIEYLEASRKPENKWHHPNSYDYKRTMKALSICAEEAEKQGYDRAVKGYIINKECVIPDLINKARQEGAEQRMAEILILLEANDETEAIRDIKTTWKDEKEVKK